MLLKTITAMTMAVVLIACTNEDKIDQSLNSVMKQSVAKAFALPSNQHLTNLPGLFKASIDGTMSGSHWDARGRRYSPQLLLHCQGRESLVYLRFAATMTSTTPLPARGDLRAQLALNGGAPRTMTLTRAAGLYRIEGALPLVRELLGAERVRLDTVTADGLQMSAQFDVRGLEDSLAGYDFYCANSWLAANAPQPQPVQRFENTRVAPPTRLGGDAIVQLERLRAEARAIDGVTSTAWLPDRSLMLGMGNASAAQVQNAVRRACELMRSHPEVRQQVEVQDTRGSTSNAQRLACPR
jgi:hypothetical protein